MILYVILNDINFAIQELKRCFKLIESERRENVNVLVSATVTSKENIDTEAGSLFSIYCNVPLPSVEERRDMITYFFQSFKYQMHPPAKYKKVVDNVAKRCNGFLRRDIEMLFGHMQLQVHLKDCKLCTDSSSANMEISESDFEKALHKASSMRTEKAEGVLTSHDHGDEETVIQKLSSQKEWDMVGGLREVKKVLNESVVWPFLYPEQFEQSGIMPPCGILMHGPPGTGKTLIAKAVASYAGTAFIAASFSSIMKGDVGASETAIRDLFRRAREKSPCVVFLDEIQAIFGNRETSGRLSNSMIAHLMMEMDELRQERSGSILSNRVVVLGATNRLDLIEPALLRPGRFDKVIHV